MKISLALLFLIAASMIIGNKLDVNLKMDDTASSYSLPFERGYILNKDGKIKLFLKFHKKNELSKIDTAERLHLYFSGDEKAFHMNDFSNGVKAFFIRVQVRPSYGYLLINSLNITPDDGRASYVSGSFKCDKVKPLTDLEQSIILKIANIPLTKVNSFKEIENQDQDYFNKIIRKEFIADWHSD